MEPDETVHAFDTRAAPTLPKRDSEHIARREVRAEDLLAGTREVLIRHGHSEYRLRLTRNDKLILTK